MTQTTDLAVIRKEVERHLADPETLKGLITTTFKDLSGDQVKQALLEGMGRGFSFENFLKKDVYAIKYGEGYNLVTGIDYNRKMGMRSGVIGVSEPTFTMTDEKTVSGIPKPEKCSISVKRIVDGIVGEFSATVYFDEYYKPGKTYNGKYKPSMWDTKPRTMIAKVAEMHALRKACPEQLSQSYIEEEMDRTETPVRGEVVDLDAIKARIDMAETLVALRAVWADLPPAAKKALSDYKDARKAALEQQALTGPIEGQTTL